MDIQIGWHITGISLSIIFYWDAIPSYQWHFIFVNNKNKYLRYDAVPVTLSKGNIITRGILKLQSIELLLEEALAF